MVIRFETERILDIARMIDRSAGAPKMYSDLVGVEFSQITRCFPVRSFRWTKVRILRLLSLHCEMPFRAFTGIRGSISSLLPVCVEILLWKRISPPTDLTFAKKPKWAHMYMPV